jgi:hypothetical protein
VAWWALLAVVNLLFSRSVTPLSHRDPGRRSRRRELRTIRRWRWLARLLWRVAERLSGGRRAWLERLSLRCTDRAQRMDRARVARRAALVEREIQALEAARARRATHGSSPSSPSFPPSAPRPPLVPRSCSLPLESPEENTRRWERTLPWGTPDRQGRGKPYPFVPLESPPPSGTVYRSPPAVPRRPPPAPTSLPRGPRRSWQ